MSAPALGAIWSRIKSRRPRVHCLTNTVVQGFTANILLAAGAVPSMTSDPGEVADFVRCCDALLVNLGTLDPARRQAIALAVAIARYEAKPWILDPVFAEVVAARRELANDLIGLRPNVVRGNAAEVEAATGSAADAERLATVARATGAVLAVSGPRDLIVGPRGRCVVANGDPLAACVTGTGCVLASLVAAACAIEPDMLAACAAAHAGFGVAIEIAVERSHGPGTFLAHLADAIFGLGAEDIDSRARVEWHLSI